MSSAENSKRRSRFRKDVIFRLYLAFFCVLFLVSTLFLVSSQSRFYGRRIDELRSQVSDLSSRLAEPGKINSVSSSREESSPAPSVSDMFYIEGTGTNRRYWYMDVQFYDETRARYYLPLRPRRSELINFHRRLSHDAVYHYHDPIPVYDDSQDLAFDLL